MKHSLMIFIIAVFSSTAWSQGSARITFISGGSTSSRAGITIGEPILGGNSQVTLGSQYWREAVVTGQGIVPETFDVSVFPNPFTSRITVSVKGNYANDFSVRIVNLLGREVFFRSKLSKSHTFDLDNYRQGSYFISVFNSKGQKIISKPLIKI